MTKKCYFCNALMNNSVPVRMYNGRTVSSCFACHGLAADAKSNAGNSLDVFCLSNASGGEMR